MPDPQLALASALAAAIGQAFGPEWAGTDPVVRPASRGRGDYQANGAMALAKQLGLAPPEVAQRIVAHLDVGAICSAVEVAGGFVNLTLADEWLAAQATALLADPRVGVRSVAQPETVVVDYSSPNLAKEMHIGHLRSTVIGDAIVRVLELVGHRVIRQNHVGDWGTQFGMLVEHLAETGWGDLGETQRHISDLNVLYQQANERFNADPEFAARARHRVVALQGGDPATLVVWRELVAESERHFEVVYERIGVLLTRDDIRGESFYNELLAGVAAELEEAKIAVVDDGALCVFAPGFVGRDGEPLPLIVRKSDGGYGYAATDLAAIRYRLRDLDARRVVYVVDARQSQHFAMLFAVARMAGWLVEGDRADHVAFGTILGADGRPFKTRSGDTPRLAELLDEAVSRASGVVAEKNPGLAGDERDQVARAVGIGAVKYADLASDRIKDYVFDWDRMLSFDGNTAPYLQYAYVRIRGIFRRAAEEDGSAVTGAAPEVEIEIEIEIVLVEPQERALALALLQFDGAVQTVADTLQPHRLCTYLFDLAQLFTAFFEACPVLRAPTPEIRASRLALCAATARVLSAGLELLGIEYVERM